MLGCGIDSRVFCLYRENKPCVLQVGFGLPGPRAGTHLLHTYCHLPCNVQGTVAPRASIAGMSARKVKVDASGCGSRGLQQGLTLTRVACMCGSAFAGMSARWVVVCLRLYLRATRSHLLAGCAIASGARRRARLPSAPSGMGVRVSACWSVRPAPGLA